MCSRKNRPSYLSVSGIVLPVLVLLFSSGSGGVRTVCAQQSPSPPASSGFTTEVAGRLKANMPSPPSPVAPEDRSDAAAYIRHYGLDFPAVEHLFGALPRGDASLAVHLYIPRNPVRLVLFVHGYLQHSGMYREALAHLLEGGSAVLACDLPGHGLSSGRRAWIGDFEEYASSLHAVLAYAEKLPRIAPFMEKRLHYLGHSTGCSVFVEYLYRYGNPFTSAVLSSPLVRSAGWGLSRIGYVLAGPFVDTVPRLHRKTTGDAAYLSFCRNDDTLRISDVPMDWTRALFAWNRRLDTYGPFPGRVGILQGTRDTVVSWRYNLSVLGSIFPHARVRTIEGGGHDILNESEPMRTEAFRTISELLFDRNE